jgi:4-carboxymuconolactone decarboxylase
MTRLQNLQREDIDEAAKLVWDTISSTRREAHDEFGNLAGPYNAYIHAPDVGKELVELGAALRFRTSIEKRLVELAIITVGALWTAEFEWWAHSKLARAEGISNEVIDAIGRGELPVFAADDERIVYDVATNLVRNGRLDDHTYAKAQALVGDQGMVELISLCGYYTLVSFLLNGFATPLPEGVRPLWE